MAALSLGYLQKNLDADQLAAVTAPPGNILCLANAGSGKTRVLTHRIAWQIEQGEPESSFMMLTFTVKAAQEMKARICQLLGKQEVSITCGTFHSVAWRLLLKHHSLVNLPGNITILDDSDAKDLMGVSREFICANESTSDRKQIPAKGDIISIYSFCRNTGQAVEDYCEKNCLYDSRVIDEIEQIIEDYEARKEKSSVLDFDDLLEMFDKLLSTPEFIKYAHRKYRNIFVDEFQDINILQASIIQKLNDGINRLTAVGDDAQCIYSWRGSDISFIRDFPQVYPNAVVYPIRNNYRSNSGIVDLAVTVINESPDYENRPKQMVSVQPTSVKPEYREFIGGWAENRMVESIMRSLRDAHNQGIPWDQMAILFRTNYSSRLLEAKLSAEGFPVSMECGFSFYERIHIKQVIYFLRFMVNTANEPAFWGMIEPLEGIGKKTSQKMFAAFSDTGCDISLLGTIPVPKKSSAAFTNLVSAIQVGWDRIQRPQPNKATSESQQLFELYYNWYLKGYMVRTFGSQEDSNQDLKRRLNDFKSLWEAMEGKSAAEFLSNVTLDPERNKKAKSDSIHLLTAHKAKGLEWDFVIIPYANDQVFPNGRGEMEDERRLFYVAITRAKQKLLLCACCGDLWNQDWFRGDKSPFLVGQAEDNMEIKRLNC